MAEQAEQGVCPKCQMPKRGAQVPTLTQWISLCSCDSLTSETEREDGAVRLCPECGKRADQGRVGSLTQFIFRADLCTCRSKELAGVSQAVSNRALSHTGPEHPVVEDPKSEVIADADLPELALDPMQFPTERYKPLSLLGKGSTGSVYKCFDRLLAKSVAVKTLSHLSAPQVVAFQNEARVTSLLDHANIVKVLDFGVTENSTPYMVLEYVDGINLELYLQQNGRLDAESACCLFATACDALHYAHSNGVFHRDLKPSNLLLVSDKDGAPAVKLIDFGIATVKHQGETIANLGEEVAGTPVYMPPEQIQDKTFDARSEVYSLGCVLFEALTGRTPFDSESILSMLIKHAKEAPRMMAEVVQAADIPPSLEHIVSKCLEKDPERRYSNMDELAEELKSVHFSEPALTGTADGAKVSGWSKTPLTVAVLVLVIGAGAWLIGGVNLKRPVDPPRTQQVQPKLEKKGPLLFLPDARESEERSKLDMLRNPEVISYSGQPLTEGTFANLGKMQRLKDLDLTEAGIEDDWLQHIENLPIRHLAMGESKLSDRGMEHIAKLKSLVELDIHATGVTDAGLAMLRPLTSMQTLDVSATKVGDGSISTILGFKNLNRLQISDTKISDAGVASL